jgi:hypothetical protein
MYRVDGLLFLRTRTKARDTHHGVGIFDDYQRINIPKPSSMPWCVSETRIGASLISLRTKTRAEAKDRSAAGCQFYSIFKYYPGLK